MSVTTLLVSIGATPSWPANAASAAALLPFAPTVEALPSLEAPAPVAELTVLASLDAPALLALLKADRKSTRLNSSHVRISYAVFCLKQKTMQLRRAAVIA